MIIDVFGVVVDGVHQVTLALHDVEDALRQQEVLSIDLFLFRYIKKRPMDDLASIFSCGR